MRKGVLILFILVFCMVFVSASVYNPTNCTNSEIRKVWNSVFKESSTNTTIFKNGTSTSDCMYFAYKVQGSRVHYIDAGIVTILGNELAILGANKLEADQSFIDILSKFNNYEDTYNLTGLLILHNYTKFRSKDLNFSELSLKFSDFFKETPENWTESEIAPPLSNETVYIFNKNTTNIAISGIIAKKRDYSGLIFVFTNTSPEEPSQTLKQQANQSIKKKQEKIDRIKIEIGGFPPFSRQSLNEIIGINESERQLNLIKRAYSNATSDENYRKILTDVAGIEVPDTVNTTKKAQSILFFPRKEEINIAILSNITGENYNSSQETDYINAISNWDFENLETRVNFQEISTTKSYQETPILKIFDVNLNEKETISGEIYFIIKNIGGLKFQNDYGQQVTSDYTYIPLSSGQQTITLLTTENIGFTDLPVFIAPKISELHIQERPDGGKMGGVSKWLFYIVLMLFIILIVVVAYVMMRGWYKNKYEDHLFKNKNNLYNLLSYISTARNKGVKNDDIKAKLKKAGWKTEQINYAIKKYETGMQRRAPIRPQAPPGARFVRKSS